MTITPKAAAPRAAAKKPVVRKTASVAAPRAAAATRAASAAATRVVRATPSSAKFAVPAKATKPAAPARYKVITDIDDALFCARVSEALDNGYILYGNPAATFNGKSVILAQAVVLKKLPPVKKVVIKKAAKAKKK